MEVRTREREREGELKFLLHSVFPLARCFFFFTRFFSAEKRYFFHRCFSSACRLFTVHRRGQRRDMERIMQTWTRDKEFKVMAIEDRRFDKYTANTHFVPFSERRGLRDRIKRYSIFRGMAPGSRIV